MSNHPVGLVFYNLTRSMSKILCLTGTGILLLAAFMTVADGSLRYLVSQPLNFVRDLGGPVSSIGVLLLLPLTVIDRANISVRPMASLGSVAGKLFDWFAFVIVLVALIVMVVELTKYGVNTSRNGDVTWMLGMPLAPFWFAGAAILFLTMVAHVATAWRPAGPEPSIAGEA